MKTRNGVFYDLKHSTYRHEENDMVFVFSSKNHLEKFKMKIFENREKINDSLSRRFNFNIDVSALADIVLYNKIETRGFLIVSKGGTELCQRNIIFAGGKATRRNSSEQ